MCNSCPSNSRHEALHGCVVGLDLPMECIVSVDHKVFIEMAATCPYSGDDKPHVHFVARHGTHDQIRRAISDRFVAGLHEEVCVHFEGINFFLDG